MTGASSITSNCDKMLSWVVPLGGNHNICSIYECGLKFCGAVDDSS